MVGTGKAAEYGILIRGGEALEGARRIDTIVLDKTGTLTRGKPAVTQVVASQRPRPRTSCCGSPRRRRSAPSIRSAKRSSARAGARAGAADGASTSRRSPARASRPRSTAARSCSATRALLAGYGIAPGRLGRPRGRACPRRRHADVRRRRRPAGRSDRGRRHAASRNRARRSSSSRRSASTSGC